MTRRTPVAILGALFALSLVAAACGSDNSSSSSTTTAAPTTTSTSSSTSTSSTSTSAGSGNAQLCADRDALTASIQDLTSVDIVKNGTAGLTTALTKVKDNLAAVKASASAQLQPQVKAFEDALTALGTAVTNLSSGGVASVVTAATTAGQAGSTLITSLSSLKC
jgi:hypothetical protein